MDSPQSRNGYHPHIAEFRSEIERTLHEDLCSKFSRIEPQGRPWYAVGLALEANRSRAMSLRFLIVSPTHIVLAHPFSVPNVATGVVYGDATTKEWRVETEDHRFLTIGEANSPFVQAKEVLHILLPKLDSFLHARKIRNPYVQSVLVFPDGYSFAGVQEVPIGPKNRGAITVVKLSEVAQLALAGPQDQKLDRAIFREWIRTLLGADDEATFKFTWFDPAPRNSSATYVAQEEIAAAAVRDPPAQSEVITLTQATDWSFDDRSERGPIEFTPEEVTLLRAKDASRAARQELSTNKVTMAKRLLKMGGSTALILLILFIAHEVYVYFKPPFPLTPYWQEGTQQQPNQSPSRRIQSGAPTPAQPPEATSARPTPVTPDIPAPTESPVAAPPEAKPVPERKPPQAPPIAPSAPTPSPPSAVNRRLDNELPRTPVPPGMYETTRSTRALEQPLDSAPVVDQLQPRTRLSVVGSDGEWLVVRSRTRNRTVYVKRDDAMLISDRVIQRGSAENAELKWKEIELQIREAILKRGVPNITVSFIGDTAYLRGTVRTARESELAELGAKTIPEVKYVHNGIWVNR